jgi:uncharacterized protein (TIGR03437 family)
MGIQKSVFGLAFLVFGIVIANAQTPAIDPGRIYNSASFAANQPVAPGSLVSIFGTNFASGITQAESVPLSTNLANVTVTFNGVAAPLAGVFHTSDTASDQINLQVPWEVLPALPPGTSGTAQIIVSRNGVPSAPQTVGITSAAPGIFAVTLSNGAVVGTGAGQAIAYGNVDGQIAAPAGAINGLTTHPAKIGDPNTLAILATGLGPVTPPVPTGNNANDGVLHNTNTMPVVTVGNVPAQVVFSGMSPQFVGVYQLNIIIASGTPTGDAIPLQIQMNGITTTDKVTIAVTQ